MPMTSDIANRAALSGITMNKSRESSPNYDDSAIQFYQTQKEYTIRFTHVPTDNTRVFPAFLTGFEDSYQSSWNPEQVYGRYDPIYTFQNTKRTITFAFEAPAADENEARHILADLRAVARMLYPTYQNDGYANTLLKAPLVRIKFANLIGRAADGTAGGLLGVLNSFSISPIVENGFFDPDPARLYAKAYSVSVNFDVLHEQSPAFVSNQVIDEEVSYASLGGSPADDAEARQRERYDETARAHGFDPSEPNTGECSPGTACFDGVLAEVFPETDAELAATEGSVLN